MLLSHETQVGVLQLRNLSGIHNRGSKLSSNKHLTPQKTETWFVTQSQKMFLLKTRATQIIDKLCMTNIQFNTTTSFSPCQPICNLCGNTSSVSITHNNSEAGFRLACRSPHCHFITWSLLAVSELQLSAATPLWPFHRVASLQSWIEVNCLWSTAVGKAARIPY